MEKSALRTTLLHGPGQPAGGVKVNEWREKSAKTKLLKSWTTHGVVSGRGTGGSAVAVFAQPITRPGGGMVWADMTLATSSRPVAARILVTLLTRRVVSSLGLQVTFIGSSKKVGQNST